MNKIVVNMTMNKNNFTRRNKRVDEYYYLLTTCSLKIPRCTTDRPIYLRRSRKNKH